MQVSTTPAPVARAGVTVTYAVTVKNTGGAAVSDLVVTAVAANLHALTCTPTAQGGTLAAGGTTTCRGARTSTQEDLRTHGGAVSATAVGFAPDGRAVRTTANGTLAVATAPPKATDDVVAVPYGRSVVLPASTNDGPAVPGGPAIDPGRTVFKPLYSSTEPDQKTVGSPRGDWYVRADGSALFVPRGDVPRSGTDTVSYRVFDGAGQSSLGHLTVTTRPGPQTVADRVTVTQGRQVEVHPLTNDKPGQQADGTAGSLDQSSIRFPDVQPVGNAVTSSDRTELDIPFVGHLSAVVGEIFFRPEPSFTGPLSVAYSVTDSLGSTASSTVDLTVVPQVPTARSLSLASGYGDDPRATLFPWSSIDSFPDTGVHVGFAGFAGRDGTPLGQFVDTAQGEWFFRSIDDLPEFVGFDAAIGFRGTASIGYTVTDDNGTRASGKLSAVVGPIISTRPDVLVSRHGADATIDPSANDTPTPLEDGEHGSFNPRFAVFATAGQPTGSTVTDQGKTLTVPGRGRLWFSGGRITFRPQAGFVGDAGTVVYQVEDLASPPTRHGPSAVGRVHLVVTGDRPVATDDTAGTAYGLSVTLPGATDDDPGSVPGLTATFPALGQPDGSVVGPGGRSVRVPDEGEWTVLSSGAVTFAPVTGFVGSASPVIYRITRTDGVSDTGALQVTVAPGIRAPALSALRAQGSTLVVDPLVKASPGYGADGSLGGLDLGSVRFPTTGQPLGAIVSADGRSLSFGIDGPSKGFAFTVDISGLVHVSVPSGFRGLTPRVRFTVQGTAGDASGFSQRQEAASSLVLTVTGRDPVAVDDAVTVTAPVVTVITLPAALNDIPASNGLPLDVDDASLPLDQLPALPQGSRIDYIVSFNSAQWTADVPGEGYWQIDPFSGKAYFDPVATFVGTTTPLRYRVQDAAGNSVDGTLTVTVRPAPVLQHATATGATPQGVAVTVDVARGTSGPAGDGAAFGGDQPTGSTVPDGSDYRTLVVPGEGTYTIGYGATKVSFRPVQGFRGTTRPVQVVAGLPQTGLTQTSLTVRVEDVDPAAQDDSATTSRGVPVRVRLLDNDAPGSPTRVLVTSSVRLTAQGLPVGATLSADGQTLSVPGRGVFAAAGDGTVTFYPRAGVVGTVPTVGYVVADVNGTKASAGVTVRVG